MLRIAPMKLRVPDEVASFIKSLHPELKRKVRASLHFIQNSPESGKALREEFAGLRSYRVGRFRIIYRVHRKMLEVVAIGPRARIYEETYILLTRRSRNQTGTGFDHRLRANQEARKKGIQERTFDRVFLASSFHGFLRGTGRMLPGANFCHFVSRLHA